MNYEVSKINSRIVVWIVDRLRKDVVLQTEFSVSWERNKNCVNLTALSIILVFEDEVYVYRE